MQIDFQRVSSAVLSQADQLLPQWFPNGRPRGHEFVVGNLQGDPGDSLSINMRTGQWSDFASGERGGDLVSLFAAMKGIGQVAAAMQLGDITPDTTTRRKRLPKREKTSIGMPPDDAPEPGFEHHLHGPAVAHWVYRDATGALIGYISRHHPADGSRKQILPWSWDTQRQQWRNLSFIKPRPLYGLDLLASAPDAPVMVVEGEKAADAARRLVGGRYVVVTWPGGSQAIHQTNWKPLHGRKVLLWPDADRHHYPQNHELAGQEMPYAEQPGHKAMVEVAGLLVPHCPEVKILDVQGIEEDGWDAADAEAQGWDWPQLLKWAKARVRLIGDVAMEDPVQEVEASAPADVQDRPSSRKRDGDGRSSSRTDRQGTLVEMWIGMDLALTSYGDPYPNLDNAVRILERHELMQGLVWLDEFSGKMMHRWDDDPQEWSDGDDIRLCLFYQRDMGITKMSVGTAHDAVRHVAKVNTRNEVREWLESLQWDGQARLDDLLCTGFGTQADDYHTRVGACWMISMVARVMEPGCKVDTMPIFEGPQGAGKSSALRAIGGKWFTECHESMTGKDFYGVMQGYLLIEISELHTFGRAEVDRIKGIISCQVDRYRVPYGRNTMDHPRRCVFAGTTNRTDWNRDETGARRFWPVACGRIDLAWLTENRSMLFAEAVARFRSGESWWDVPEQAAREAQESRRMSDTWEQVIGDWLTGQMSRSYRLDEIMHSALGIETAKQDRQSQLRCAAAMRLLGYESKLVRQYGQVRRLWTKMEEEDAT